MKPSNKLLIGVTNTTSVRFGPELVIDGSFSSGISGFAVNNGATLDHVSNMMRVLTNPDGSYSGASGIGTTPVIGKTYAVSFTLATLAAGIMRADFGGVGGNARSVIGTYTQYITAITTGPLLLVRHTAGQQADFTVDNVSIKEVR